MKSCIDWKYARIIAIAIGVGGILCSAFVMFKVVMSHEDRVSLFYYYNGVAHETLFEVIPESNWLACYCWFAGIRRNSTPIFITSLFWWAFNIILTVIAFLSYIISFDEYKDEFPHRSTILLVGAVYLIGSYIMALICFKSFLEKDRNLDRTAQI